MVASDPGNYHIKVRDKDRDRCNEAVYDSYTEKINTLTRKKESERKNLFEVYVKNDVIKSL